MSGGRKLSAQRALGEIIAAGAVSRSELALRLGASKASISRLVDQLLRSGWVSEGAPLRVAERGRNATTLLPREDLGYAIGADLEGLAIRVCLFDCQRNVIKSRRRFVEPDWSTERIIEQWRSLIVEVIERAGVPKSLLIGIGLALPGLAPGGTSAELRAHLTEGALARFDVCEALGDLGIPIVAGDNTLCVADYERRFGVARDAGRFASVLVRFGIGAAVYDRDRFFIGEGAPCSELGHLPVQPEGRLCICGERGCLDTLVSGRTWADPSTPPASRPVDQLAERAHYLGVGIGQLLKIVHVPVVILNGIYNAYEDRVRDPIEESVAAQLAPVGLPAPELRFGDELEYKACIGAGLRAIDQRLVPYLAALDRAAESARSGLRARQ